MIKVKLLGILGQNFIRELELDIKSAAEAVRALSANFPGFSQYLANSERTGINYKVYTRQENIISLSEKDLSQPISQLLIIAPVVAGSGGIGRIIAGSVLLAAAFVMPASLSVLGLGLSSTTVGLIGAALILGGISSLLTPKVKKTYLIDGQTNTTGQGNPVPLCYGRLIVGSQVISAGITTFNY